MIWRWETKPVWGGSQIRDPHIQTRSQATLASKRVTREESKETHLSSSILVTGGNWWENSHPHSSLQSSVTALLHIKTGGIMGEWEQQVFNLPNSLIKTKNLPIIAERKLSTIKTTKYYWEETNYPKLRNSDIPRICAGEKQQSIRWMETEESQCYQQVITKKLEKWNQCRTAAQIKRTFAHSIQRWAQGSHSKIWRGWRFICLESPWNPPAKGASTKEIAGNRSQIE